MAIYGSLQQRGYRSFVLRTHAELDLTDQHAVNGFFCDEQPEYVFLAAAHVGGILANNTYRADFIYRNLMIQNNVINAAYRYGAKKLLFLGSTCIYPREAPQPMPEECLLASPLEYTNEPYAIAKIAGIKMCESYNLQYGTNFMAVMPTNLYGPNDNFDLERSHVLPAMIRKTHLARCLHTGDWDALRRDLSARPIAGVDGEATEEEIIALLYKYGITPARLTLWGSGTPRRELLWSEDMADACVYLMEKVDFADLAEGRTEVRNTHINIGTGKDSTIWEISQHVKTALGYAGEIDFDGSHPDGTMRKLTDVTRLQRLGWHHRVELAEGIRRLSEWYLDSVGR